MLFIMRKMKFSFKLLVFVIACFALFGFFNLNHKETSNVQAADIVAKINNTEYSDKSTAVSDLKNLLNNPQSVGQTITVELLTNFSNEFNGINVPANVTLTIDFKGYYMDYSEGSWGTMGINGFTVSENGTLNIRSSNRVNYKIDYRGSSIPYGRISTSSNITENAYGGMILNYHSINASLSYIKNEGGTVNISDVSFVCCGYDKTMTEFSKYTSPAGSLINSSGASNVSITNTLFLNCFTFTGSYCYFTGNANATYDNCKINETYTFEHKYGSWENLGFIEAKDNDGLVTVKNTIFDNNKCKMYSESNSTGVKGSLCQNDNGNMIIQDCDFNECSFFYGACVYLTSPKSMTIKGCDFYRCSAVGNGAIINMDGNSVTNSATNSVTNSVTMEDCTVSISSATNGGAIYGKGGTLIAKNTLFTTNSADYGGVVAMENSFNVKFDTCTLENNYARFKGGVLYSADNATGTFELVDTIINQNSAKCGGVAYNLGNPKYVIKGSSIKNNTTLYDGSNTTYIEAQGNGGVFYTEEGKLTIELESSYIFDNSAARGGVLYTLSEVVMNGDSYYEYLVNASTSDRDRMFGSIISGNISIYDGGCIYAKATPAKVTLNSINFLGNNTAGKGAVLYAYGCSLVNLYSVNMVANSTTDTGSCAGGYLEDNSEVNIVDIIVTGNSGTAVGALYFHSSLSNYYYSMNGVCIIQYNIQRTYNSTKGKDLDIGYSSALRQQFHGVLSPGSSVSVFVEAGMLEKSPLTADKAYHDIRNYSSSTNEISLYYDSNVYDGSGRIMACFYHDKNIYYVDGNEAKPTTGVIECDGFEYDLYQGNFIYELDEEEKSATYYYSDGYFGIDEKTYNPSLASMSLVVTMAGMMANTNLGYTYQANHWYNLMKDIGYNELYLNSDATSKPTKDSVGVMIGSKDVAIYDDSIYTVIAINIRGDQTSEIASVVNLGDGKTENVGYQTKANKVMNEIEKYIQDCNLTTSIVGGKVKFWITGFGIGGNVASFVSKRLIEKYQSVGNQVYGYAFGTGLTGLSSELNPEFNYNSIYNINMENDFFTNVVPESWGYSRYGKTITIDHYEVEESYQAYLKQLKAVSPYTFFDGNMEIGTLNLSIDNQFYSDYYLATNGSFDVTMKQFSDRLLYSYTYYSQITKAYYMNSGENLGGVDYPSLQNAMITFFEVYGDLNDYNKEQFLELLFGAINNVEAEYKEEMINVFGHWSEKTSDEKATFINRLWDAVNTYNSKHQNIATYVSEDRMANFKKAFVTLVNEVMKMLDADKQTSANNAFIGYGTNDKYPIFGTIARNYRAFNESHNEEIYFAWLRSVDANYSAEENLNTKVIKINSFTTTAEKATLKQNGVEVNATGDSFDSFTKFTIDSPSSGMVFYSISANGSKVSLNETNNAYCFPFELYSLYGDSTTVYNVEVYTYYFGIKSESNFYEITINGLDITGYEISGETYVYDDQNHFIETNYTGVSKESDIFYYYKNELIDATGFKKSGTYTIDVLMMKEGYKNANVQTSFTINKCVVEVPIVNKKVYGYNGEKQTFLVSNKYYTVTNGEGTSVGTYSAIIQLNNDDYIWSNRTHENIQMEFEIIKGTYFMGLVKWNYTSSISYSGNEVNVGIDESTLPVGVTLKEYAGTVKATDAGSYNVKAIFNYDEQNYYNPEMELNWYIIPITVPVNWCANSFTYNGSVQKITAKYTDIRGELQYFAISVDREFKDAGIYTATATSTDPNYKVLEDANTCSYTIKQANLINAVVEVEDLVYSGKEQEIVLKSVKVYGADATYRLKDGSISKVKDVNNTGYKITLVGEGNFFGEKTVSVKVLPYEVEAEWCEDNFTFNGKVQTITASFTDLDGKKNDLIVSMDREFKDFGIYIVKADMPEDITNYSLAMNCYYEYYMQGKLVAKPTIGTTDNDYTGKVITYTPVGYDIETMTIIGNKQSAINEKGYTVMVSLTDTVNTSWEDGSKDTIEFVFYIHPIKIDKPTNNETRFEYTGSNITYIPENFNENTMVISDNEQIKVNETGYIVTVGLKDKDTCTWSDGTQDDITFNFVIYPKTEKLITKEELKQGYSIAGILDNAIAGKVLSFATEIGTFTFNSSAVIDLQYKDVILKATLEEVDNNAIINIELLGEEPITKINGKITVNIDYQKKTIENATVKFYEYNESGERSEKVVSFKNNKVNFTTDHTGKYEVAYEISETPIQPDQPEEPVVQKTGCGCNSGVDVIYSFFILPLMFIPFGFRLMKNKKEDD